jgi:hypothetical protein
VVPALDVKAVAPELILDRRLVKKGNMAVTQIMVKWSGLPYSSATWEDYSVLRSKFPASAAWGQSVSLVGSSVTTQPVAPIALKSGNGSWAANQLREPRAAQVRNEI